MMSRVHFASLCALGFLCSLLGCRRSGVQSCLDLVEAKQYETSAQRCEGVYVAEGDPRAGAAVVKAYFNLREEKKVLAWVDRLAKADRILPGVHTFAAGVHQQRGEIAEAEREFRLDLAVCRAAGDHRRAADILYRLFYLSWGRSGYQQTFLLASEALEEALQSRDRDLQARAAQALHSALFEVGDLQGARRALETAKDLVDEEDRTGRAHLLSNWGAVFFAEGRLALARREFEQALELGQAATPEFLRAIHLNLSEVYLKLGDVERSAHHLQEAWKRLDPGQPVLSAILLQRARLDLARERLAEAGQTLEAALSQDPDPDWAWQLEYQRGVLEERRGNLRAAESAYRRAAEIVEDLRRSMPFNELKAWLLDDKRQPFEALFLLHAEAGESKQALATADRAQARTLLDAFLHSSSVAGGPWQTNSSLQRITGLESLVPAMSESPVAALQPIDRVLGALGDRRGLVYFEAGRELWLVSVSGRRVRLHALAAPASEIRDLAERLLAHPDDRRIAARLGEILLPPGALPERGTSIFLVADGFLGNLPFAALRRNGRYLVEDHVLLSVPSLSALAALEGSPREPSGPPLVLVDGRGDLPAAAAEGRAVGNLLRSEVQASNKATFAELKRASHARILHLATHTGLDPRGPWLQLADRRVGASEIAAGHIGPRLAVLATCASGARSGRQMWGSLSAAFLAGGSRSVLASLWSIEDERAREFILRFYAGGGASKPAAALARAQRVAIAQGQSPTVWAPFVLFGSDRP